MSTDKLELLHKQLQINEVTGLGDYESFKSTFSTEKNQTLLYNRLKESGYTGMGEDISSFQSVYFSEPEQEQQQDANEIGGFKNVANSTIQSFARTFTQSLAYNQAGLANKGERILAGDDKPGLAKTVLKNMPGIAGSVVNGLDGAALVSAGLQRFLSKATGGEDVDVSKQKPEERYFFQLGDRIGKGLENALPTNPELQESFWLSVVPQGVGSFGAFVLAGAAGGGVGALALGSSSMGGEEYANAIKSGATQQDAFEAQVYNWMIGSTEAIPTNRVLARGGAMTSGAMKKVASKMGVAGIANSINRLSGNKSAKILADGFQGGLEELMQETLQSSLTNLVAQKKYDESRQLLDGVMEAGGAGGVIGFAGGIIVSSLKRSRAKISNGQSEITDQDVISGLQALEDHVQGESESLNDLTQAEQENEPISELTDDEAVVDIASSEIFTESIPMLPIPIDNEVQTEAELSPEIQLEQETLLDQELTTELDKEENEDSKNLVEIDGEMFPVDRSTVLVPVERMRTNEKLFQNREKLKEEKVQRIVDDFSNVDLDPLVLWKDIDGEIYVLAGHHRFEAMKRLGKESSPARFLTGTQDEARNFATVRSNTGRDLESPSERAKVYREMREKGESKKAIKDKAKIVEGTGAASRAIDFSYLDTTGDTLKEISNFQETAEGDNKDLMMSIGQRIGRVRQMYSQLTTSHENQLFKFLMKPENNDKFRSLGAFSEFIGTKVNFGFEQDKPLALERRRSEMERQYDNRLFKANKVVDDLRTEREERLKKLNNAQRSQINGSVGFGEVEITNDYIQKVKAGIDEQIRLAQKEAILIEKEKGVFEKDKEQDLFFKAEQAEAALEKAGFSKEQTNQIKKTNEQTYKSVESSLQGAINTGRSAKQQGAETSGEEGNSQVDEPQADAYGANNSIVDRSDYERTKANFNRDLNKISGGLPIDPVQLFRLVKMGAFHIEAGARTFSAFSQKMLEQTGFEVQPYLKLIYQQIRARNDSNLFDDDATIESHVRQMQEANDFVSIDNMDDIANNDSGRSIDELLSGGIITEEDVNNATEVLDRVRPNNGRLGSEQEFKEREDAGMLGEHQTYKEMSEALLPDAKAREAYEREMRNFYRRQPHEFTLAAAREFMAKVGFENAVATVKNPEQQISDSVRVTLAQQIVLAYQERIDAAEGQEQSQLYDQLADFVDETTRIYGEYGRALNAIKILSKLNPRAFVITFKKAMQKKANRVMPLLEGDITTANAEITQVSKDVVDAKEQQIKSLMDEIAEIQSALRGSSETVGGLLDANNQLETELHTQQAQRELLTKQIEALTDQIKELEGRPVGSGIEGIKAEIDQKKQILGQLDDVINKIYFELSGLQGQLAQAKKKLSESGAKPNRDNKKDGDGIWQRYRVAIAKSVMQQLAGSSPSSIPLQEFTNALMQEIRSKLPTTKNEKSNRPAIDMILDVVRNPDRYQEALDTVYDTIQQDQSLSQDVKQQALALVDGFNNREVSVKLVRKAMGDALTDLDMKMKELITDHYGVDTNNRMALLKKLVEQGGLNTNEAELMAERVDATLKQEIIDTRKKKIEAFLKKMDKKTKGEKASRGTRASKFVNELMDLSRLGALSQADLRDSLARFLEMSPDPKALAKIDQMAKEVNLMVDSSAKDQKMVELMSFIAQQKGISWWDISTSVAYSNMLSGIPTQAVNFGSTFANVLLNGFSLWAMNPFNKSGYTPMIGLLKGFIKGIPEAEKVLKTGVVTGTRLQKIDQMGGDTLEMLATSDSKLQFALSFFKYTRRVMAASDMLFFKGAEEMRFYYTATKTVQKSGLRGDDAQKLFAELLGEPFREQANIAASNAGLEPGTRDYKHFVHDQIERNRDQSLQEDAVKFGLTSTYNQTPEGVMGSIALGINQGFNLIDKKTNSRVASTVIRLGAIPFTTIVANVLNEQANYVPVIGLWRYMNAKNDVERRNVNDSLDDAHKIILMKNMAGTIAFSLLAAIAFTDDPEDNEPSFRIHGRGPIDYKKARQLGETGWKEYTVQMGKTYFSYKDSPLGLLLALVGNYSDAVRYKELDDKDLQSRLFYAFKLIPQTMLNMSFLSGAARLVENVSREGASKVNIVKDLLATPVRLATPSLFRSVNQIFDPKIYTKDTVQELIAASTPSAFAVNDRHPVINRLGEPIRNDWSAAQGLLGRFYSTQKEHPVFSFLTKRNLFIPTPNPNSVSYIDLIGQSRVMNENQYYNFIYYSGRQIRRDIILDKPNLITMTNEQIDKRVRQISRLANEQAKQRVALGGVNQSKVEISLD